MRLTLLICVLCGAVAAQQPVGLTQFLGLTAAQVIQVKQLNDAFSQLTGTNNDRENTLRGEIAVESAKTSPDPAALGQRYIEIDSIEHDLTQEASLHAKLTTLLTPAQMALLQQVSSALVQQSLNFDASCGYLEASIGIGGFTFYSIGSFSGYATPYNTLAAFLLGYSPTPSCSSAYPLSIRNYLALTDSQVAGILGLESAYQSLKAQKDNRTNDVNVEIRDETAKLSPDPLALGVRYAELAEISQELQQADTNGRTAARNLLTPAQQAKLKSLMDGAALLVYQFPAFSCHLLSVPPGIGGYGFSGTSCQLN